MAKATTREGTPNPQLKDRTIRVFISSTFKDMQRERELLVKQVFPELRSICAKRFVNFTEIDLRWGITKEQSAEIGALRICLDEIHLSRPYFIGLLGERYGWIPNISPAILAKEPWLEEHIKRRTSVTELEILHGVLNNPLMTDHAFFYFRDPKYLKGLNDKEAQEMTEHDIPEDVLRFGLEEAAQLTKKRKGKLADLKKRIRKSGLPLVKYPNPQTLADDVRNEFIKLIDRLYPEKEIPDLLDQEKQGHEVYSRKKLFAYVSRPKDNAVLDAYAEKDSPGKGLVVTGDSGSGKTCLLADWTRKQQISHPNEFLFQHFFGATPHSATVAGFLQRLLGELKQLVKIPDEIPNTKEKMIEALPVWLAKTAGRGKIVLVLDALNQIQGDEADQRLTWFPLYFSGDIHVIVSALPSKALDTLKDRGWKFHDLPLIKSYSERIKMINVFLGNYGKTMTKNMKYRVASATATINPLFLRTVLEELRQFGSNKKLPQEVTHYLQAKNPSALFRLVLKRWQQDFDAGCDLVSRTFCHLWAARQGLAETEFLELLGTDAVILPRQVFSPLFLAMEPHLTQRYGLFSFGHDFLRNAAQVKFLKTKDKGRKAHIALADFFEPRSVSMRKAVELPYQLREADQKDRLNKLLLDLDMFSAVFENDKFELMGYWVWLKKAQKMGPAYRGSFENWCKDKGDTEDVAYKATELYVFLNEASLYNIAEPLMKQALNIDERIFGAGDLRVATHKNNLGVLFKSTERFTEAAQCMQDALYIFEKKYHADDPRIAVQLGNLAMLFADMGKLTEAEPLALKALRIDEQNYGEGHPEVAVRLGYLAVLLNAGNQLKKAEGHIRLALAIDERNFESDHPRIANDLNILAQLCQDTGRLNEAEKYMVRAIDINEKAYGKNNPVVAVDLNNLAQLLKICSRFDEAERLLRRALRINSERYGKQDRRVATVLINMSNLYLETGRFQWARPAIMCALRIQKKMNGDRHRDVATCLCSLAMFYQACGQPEKGEQPLLDALKIDRESFGNEHPTVARDLGKLGSLFLQINRLGEAEQNLEEALRIGEQCHKQNHPDIAIALNNLADFYLAANRVEKAKENIERALAIDKDFFGHCHPAVALDLAKLARLLMDTCRPNDAKDLLVENLAINQQIYGEKHSFVVISHVNLFELFMATGSLVEAEEHVKKALKIDIDCYGENDCNVADDLANYAILLRKFNRLEEAEQKMRRAIVIYQTASGDKDPVIPHLMNGLCTILVMLDKLPEAQDWLTHAWALKAGRHDLTSARILFVQFTVALLEKKDHSIYIGKLKTLLRQGSLPNYADASKIWDIAFFIESLDPKLPGDSREFLSFLAEVLNDISLLKKVEEYELWRSQPEIRLE